jgi:hypothetical protein
LQRKLTFEENAGHVFDEIVVRRADELGSAETETGSREAVDFSAGFFMFADCGLTPTQAKNLPDGWFSIALTGGNRWAPRFAYGFACTRGIPISSFDTPVPGYPYPDKAHKTFAWRTSRCKSLKMVHLFTFGESTDSDGSAVQKLQPDV